ncbi:glycoside hydrolase family 70 protein [Lactobacillaceae bacterium Scapto_B20]
MNLNKNNTKVHYKMYKSGKKWIISGITTATILITVSYFNAFDRASADTQTNVTTSIKNDANTETTSSSNTSQSTSNEAPSASSNSAQPSFSANDSKTESSVASNSAQSSANSLASDSNNRSQSVSSSEDSKTTSSVSGNSAQSSSNSADSKTASSASDSSFQSSSSSADSKTASSASDSNAQSSSSSEDSKSASNSSNSADSSASADSNSTSDAKSTSAELNGVADLPTGGSYETTNGGQTYKYVYQNSPLKGLYNDNGKLVYFDGYDGTQARGTVYNINNANYIFNKTDGSGTKIAEISGGQYRQANANDGQNSIPGAWVYQQTNNLFAKGIQSVDGNIRYFDTETGSQLKGGTAEVDGTDYYFEPSQGDLIGNVNQIVNNGKYVNNNGAIQYVDSDNNVVKGLTSVNNALQYFDTSTGNQVKNQQVIANGVTYYFDDSGNGQYLFTNTGNSVSTDTSQHNVANSTDPNDYKDTVDGFLTADSWYRPKDILDGGTTWRASNSSDYRPIITNWWPNKDIQVNYLKLMQDNGLLSNDVQYSRLSDQTVLDQAAQTAQVSIEQKIKQANSTDWLNNLLFQGSTNNPAFVSKQSLWNISSEDYGQGGNQWFQGGYLKYGNNSLTPNTNSNYRQSDNYFSFLLANDVDNSNPSVQAENLNWLYYMMNFGSITDNNSNANFDGIRIDAPYFIDNSMIQRTFNYMRDAYGMVNNSNNANSHLSIVEGGINVGSNGIRWKCLS